jgi:thymidine kinase
MSYRRVTVIAGSMFSGKSSELIRICRREEIAKRKVKVFKPSTDTRTGEEITSTHTRLEYPATSIPSYCPEMILNQTEGVSLVGIEEAQFFHPQIVPVVDELAKRGIKVVVVGLDLDFKGQPFGPMPQLLALADTVTKLTAICTVCGEEATRTQRIFQSDNLVEIGTSDKYEARCRNHHTV